MRLLVLAVASLSAFAQAQQNDNYGFPEGTLLEPSSAFSRLRLTPSNFQALLGNPALTSVSSPSGTIVAAPQSISFAEVEDDLVEGVRSSNSNNLAVEFDQPVTPGDIFIEDFSPIQPATTFRPSNNNNGFSSSNSGFSSSNSGFSSSNSGFNPSPVTSSTFSIAQNTPPTPTNIPSRNVQFSNNRISSNSLGQSFGRQTSGRQTSSRQTQAVQGGVDFSQATRLEDGRLCVIKEESVETLSKDPILQCTHKSMEKCHYTYITSFKAAQEEVCEENFEKKCQITFKQEATTETVRKCYRPQQKVCNGQGPEECRTVYESSCTTRYVEKSAGKFVGDTSCEKLPVKICGAGCVNEEGPEECHEKQIDSLVDVPEEVCDLNPQKTCRLQTKLVPSLTPKQECTKVPQETCTLNFSQPKRERKPLRTEWCLDQGGVGTSQAQPAPAAPLPVPTGYARSQKSFVR